MRQRKNARRFSADRVFRWCWSQWSDFGLFFRRTENAGNSNNLNFSVLRRAEFLVFCPKTLD
jgi:hypothetical protein